MPAQKFPPAPVMIADRQVGAVVEFVDRIGQTLTDRKVHRVARLRPIDGDDENPSAALP